MFSPTIIRSLSFTASRDWWYRLTFSHAGLRSVSSDLGDGTTMHCWVPKLYKQSKPNLLLVHGFGANAMWQYSDTIDHFIPKYNVYVPDLIFFGRSYTTQKERSESFQARCLMKLMHIHGVQKVSFVGISYGGFVGYSMACQFPEVVEKAVLCCTGVCIEEKDLKEGLFKVQDLDEAGKILMPQNADKLRELMRLSFVKPPKGVPDWRLTDFINVMCKNYVNEKRELIEEILKDRQLSKLPKIRHPTMIVWGEQDQIFPIELGYRLQRHLGSNAQLVVIKEAGHAVNLEKSREFLKHLKTFLNESHMILPQDPTLEQ
ncbi:monoacylglycerol lipase abhd6-A-like [Chenopodium quinoa]|uniref:AB hydrolase-1 domain-containing protein n=1 Tax=Chenopodium quinoa TaxID=63459 RepID=A0A803LGP2_CHEQI|nr:monoacylglycerol lipase abhd6-A-like [Chenopodium quinoa]